MRLVRYPISGKAEVDGTGPVRPRGSLWLNDGPMQRILFWGI